MFDYDLILRSRRVITPNGETPAAVCVANGRVVAIDGYRARLAVSDPAADRDLGERMLLPGLVDTHVHVNEPGRTEWEGFATATRAAALGGVTTLIDMPLNNYPPTTTPTALSAKQAAARGRCSVDVGFWGGAVPENLGSLQDLKHAGVRGFKCFLADSGVPEFRHLSVVQFEAAAREIAAFSGMLLVHAEDEATLGKAADEGEPGVRTAYADFVATRPAAAELVAIEQVLDVSRRIGLRAHILHLSTAEALPLLAAAKAEGLAVTVETCPHYLTFAAHQIPDASTQYKCCPPIRGSANREKLWQGLKSGVIDFVVSDHSPCAPELKRFDDGDFMRAWGGIASLQLGLSVMWTEASARGWSVAEVVERMARRTADFVGLPGKGRIAVGADADLVVFDPEAEYTVDAARLAHRHPVTPYDGRKLRGVVLETYLRGVPLSPADERPRGVLF